MHTTCFDQPWSSSGVSKFVDETAVLPSAGLIFGICPRLCDLVSYGDGQFLLLCRVQLLWTYGNKYSMCSRMLWYNITHLFILLACDILNGTVSSQDDIPPNERKIINWKGYGKRPSCPDLWHSLAISLQELPKPGRILIGIGGLLWQTWNRVLPNT
jgi:hypothetical protein